MPIDLPPDILNIDKGYSVEQNIPMAEKRIADGVVNSQDELVRLKHTMDSIKPDYVSADRRDDENKLEDIKLKLGVTRAETSDHITAELSDEEASNVDMNHPIDYFVSDDSQFVVPYTVDSNGKKISSIDKAKIAVEDFLGKSNNAKDNQQIRVRDEKYKGTAYTTNPKRFNSIRGKMLTAKKDLDIDFGLNILGPDALSGEAPLSNRERRIIDAETLMNIETVVAGAGVELKGSKDVSDDHISPGSLLSHIVSEEGGGSPYNTKMADMGKLDDVISGRKKPTDIDLGISQNSMKKVFKAGGDVVKVGAFHILNDVASLSQGLIVVEEAVDHLKTVVEKAKVGKLDHIQTAAAVTGIYNGSDEKVSEEWIKCVKGKKYTSLKLGKTRREFIGINLSRQISTALFFDNKITGFEDIKNHPNSTASRLLNMRINAHGETKTAYEWIKDSPQYKELGRSSNRYNLNKRRNLRGEVDKLKNEKEADRKLEEGRIDA